MIDLAAGLHLPDSAVTNAYALLGMKGSGKSNAAVVMAEAVFDAGIPWVAIDPKGDWWGIRSGKRAGATGGLPVVIFGGLHADVPIDERAGTTIADLIVAQHLTCLIDTSEFSKGESIRFLTAFFDRLYRLKNSKTFPMHVFLEECDDYVPQRVYKEVAALVRAVEIIVKRGRQRGLGITLASQRSASINKDVLSQTDTLIAMRTTDPRDRTEIGRWLTYKAGSLEIVDELPTLLDGEAWVSSPAQLRLLKKFRFHRRRTFDSGATPELGEKVRPATLADIDVAAVSAALSVQIEKAKADDPKLLRARIAELERHLNAMSKSPPVEKTVERVVEVVPDAVRDALRGTLTAYDRSIQEMGYARGQLSDELDRLAKIGSAPQPRQREKRGERAGPGPTPSPVQPAPVREALKQFHTDNVLGKRERLILRVLAVHREVDVRKLAILTGYSPKASTIPAGLSTLRKAGFVSGMAITDTGRGALGEVEPLPSGAELLDFWRAQLGKRERAFLDVLVEVWPSETSLEELAERCNYSADASTIPAGMSKLRALGIVDGWGLSGDFADAIA